MNTQIKIAYNEKYVFPLPKDHKFPIKKYSMIVDKLLKENIIRQENLFSPIREDLETVKLTHDDEYIEKLQNQNLSTKEIRKIGFPLTDELVEREFIITNGTRVGAEHAIDFGIAFNVAGGTHHAYSNEGQGFCIFNDVAVASNYLLRFGLAKKIFIIDLDVHQGNGTAKIFENEEKVYTFSFHGKNKFPLHKEKSDFDLGVNHNIDDEGYMLLLETHLREKIKEFQPDFLFYIAGADVLNSDRWGQMSLSINGALERDKYVLGLAHSLHLPIMITMGGGYSPDIDVIVEAHCNTFKTAFQLYE